MSDRLDYSNALYAGSYRQVDFNLFWVQSPGSLHIRGNRNICPRPEITKELPSFNFKICIALNLLNIEELLRHISARQGPMTVHNRFLFCVSRKYHDSDLVAFNIVSPQPIRLDALVLTSNCVLKSSIHRKLLLWGNCFVNIRRKNEDTQENSKGTRWGERK